MEQAQLPPVAAGLFRCGVADDAPMLLGGECEPCSRRFFPCPPLCPACLGEVRECALGSRGRLYSYTVVRVKPPLGLPQPYGVAYVDLPDSGLRVFALLDPDAIDRFEIGQEVQLAVAALGHDSDGNPCLRPYFTHVEADDREAP